MNIFSIIILSVAAILCYIDFFYILKNQVYCFKKGANGQRVQASKKAAWFNFALATLSLDIVLVNIIKIPNFKVISNVLTIVLIVLFVYQFFKKK